jgi:tetratricopeptide (TPR) repeat protein
VTYSTLINLSPDHETAKGWFNAMREAGVQPNEFTASSLAKGIRNVADAERLTEELSNAQAFVGEAYYAAVYSRLAQTLGADDLFGWHVKQTYRRPVALAAAIAAFVRRGQVQEACRVALAFPYLEAARKLFRDHGATAVSLLSDLLAKEFEPYKTTYALGYCFLENGRLDESLAMFNRLLKNPVL